MQRFTCSTLSEIGSVVELEWSGDDLVDNELSRVRKGSGVTEATAHSVVLDRATGRCTLVQVASWSAPRWPVDQSLPLGGGIASHSSKG